MASEGEGGSALLAKGHVEATVVVKKGQDDVTDIFKSLGEQASKSATDAGDKLGAGIVGGMQAAGKDATKVGGKIGEDTGDALHAGVLRSAARNQTGRSMFDRLSGGLTEASGAELGAKWGQAIGDGIGKPLGVVADSFRKLTGDHSKAIDAMNTQYDSLGSKISAARGELDRMAESNKNAAKFALSPLANAPGAVGPEVFKASEILAATTAVEKLEKDQERVGNGIKSFLENEAAGGHRVSDAFESASKKISESGEAVSRLGIEGGEAAGEVGGVGEAIAGLVADPVVLVTAAVVALGAAAVGTIDYLYNLGDKWEEVFNAMAIQTGATGEALEGMKTDTLQIAGTVAQPIEQIGADIGVVKQRFGDLNDSDLKGVTTGAANLQTLIGKFDVGQVGDSFAAFGVNGAKDQTDGLNLLFKAYQKTGVGVDAMARNLANAEPIATQFGLTFDQTTGFLTSFASHGLGDGSKGIQALAAAQKSFEKGVKGNAKKGILGVDPITDEAGLNKAFFDTLTNIKKLEDGAKAAGGATTDLGKTLETQAKTAAEAAFGKSNGIRGGGADNILDLIKSGALNPADLQAPFAGLNQTIDQTAEKTKTVSQGWTEMKSGIDAALAPIAEKVQGFIAKGLEGISGWVTAHKAGIVGFFSDMVSWIVDAANVSVKLGSTFIVTVGYIMGGLAKMGRGFGDVIGAIGTAVSLIPGMDGIGESIKRAGDSVYSTSQDIQKAGDETVAFGKKLGTGFQHFSDAVTDAMNKAREESAKTTGIVGKNAADAGEFWKHAFDNANPPAPDVNMTPANDKMKAFIDQWSNAVISPNVSVPGQATQAPPGGQPLNPLLAPYQHHQDGGAIYGAGRKGKDSVPAILAPGEHVWTDREVDAVGGQNAMYHLRSMAASGMLKGFTKGGNALFDGEGPQYYGAAFAHNSPFAKGAPYQSSLSAIAEKNFRAWVAENKVPFDPNDATPDYDMRGYYRAMLMGDVPPWSGGTAHFPDTFKTPYDTTFSAESEYATPGTPFVWQGDKLIDTRNGQLIFGFEGGGAADGTAPDLQAANVMRGTKYDQGNRDDCSGMVGRVVNGTLGLNGPLPTTLSMESWLKERGFVSGLGGPGQLSIGWYNHGNKPNDGHTAMTLSDGEHAEAGGSHGTFEVGGDAAGADNPEFNKHMYLPQMYGEGSGGSGGVGGLGGSGGATAAQLGNANAAVNSAVNAKATAQSNLDADTAAGASAKKLAADQDKLAKATDNVTVAQQKFADLQAKTKDPSKDGKAGQDPIAQLAGIAGNALKENLPPGFSDPTSWPGLKSAAGLLKFAGGFVKDPTGRALLNAGAAGLGGDGSGVATSLEGLIPKPFGAVQIGSPGDAGGVPENPVNPGSQTGNGFDPSAFLPNLPKGADMPGDGNNDSNAAKGDTNIHTEYHGAVDAPTVTRGQGATAQLHRQVTHG